MAKQPSAKAQAAAYFDALPPDTRKALKQVRAAIRGTIRFPLDEPVPLALVKKLVKARIAEAKQRGR